ncbi:Putative peptidoglycan binding domain-containing protein [Streptomyces sp. TLI_053]|uniref:peptidoglycan-binding protein n=1 Tax=Streptomyces sp. TLI_053 TaxID=1855352 RepID=UPI00087A1C12|nr:peptidoglycan-binding protein [Streptomyces sp. TLI_053]SDS57878.1 Putative peptidoglycan binding domain-containing protein [Streptomyces sp. TLI_053]
MTSDGPAAAPIDGPQEPRQDAPSRGSRREDPGTRRRGLLAAVVIGSVLVGAAGAGAAALLKSPAQVAAETAAPEPDTLTAPVEHKVIADLLVTRGKVTAASTTDISVPSGGGAPGTRPLVTKVKVKAGDQLSHGKVLFEMSGRPVFTLAGALPAYRDLQTGAKGEDVAQLQNALARAGHRTSPDASGTFGAGTERAVTAFYKSIGYAPVRNTVPAPDAKPAPDGPARSGPGDKSSDGKTAPMTPTASPTTPARPRTTVTVPMSEVVFLNTLPVRADTVEATVGKAPGEKLMTVSTGSPLVVADVSAREKTLLRNGQPAEIVAEDTGARTPGTVQDVTDAPRTAKGDQPGAASGYLLRVLPAAPLPAELAGKEVRVSVTASSSEGPVLAVPSTAVSTGADGRTGVTVLGADGIRRVPVHPGASGGGFVEVVPDTGATLVPGDKVVVGGSR